MMSKHRKLQFIVLAFFLILFGRFYFLQIHEFQKFERKAGNNSLRKLSLNAPRGIIYDRHGIPLVDNKQIYDLSLIPFDVTENFNYELLNSLLGISKQQLKSTIENKKTSFYRFRPYVIDRHIDFIVHSKLEEYKLDFPGMIFSEFPARSYPNKARLTHVLGYLRVVTDGLGLDLVQKKYKYKPGDVVGFSGIEKMYEHLLRGKDGTEIRLVDIYGIDHGMYKQNSGQQPIPGNELYLTIDSKLQAYSETLFKDKKGVVICMIPDSGEIIAYLSMPDYDLNSFVGPVPISLWSKWNSNIEKPLLNRGIQGLYPPGSIFKLIAAALALEKNIINPDWTVDCKGAYNFGDRDFHCWNMEGHGNVNLDKAIYQSCNIYFYNLMQKLSLSDWKRFAEKFGFGSLTEIDLLGERSGIIPDKSYLNSKYGKYGWAKGNLLTFIIGQGDLLVTPIQIAQMMNIISTRGNTFRPHLHLGKGSEVCKVKLKPKTWDYLEKSTWEVVNHIDGTGKTAKVDGLKIHGKTGTAQNSHGEDHSLFAGYMIDGLSKMSLVVLVENGGKGSGQATTIANKIFEFVKKQNAL